MNPFRRGAVKRAAKSSSDASKRFGQRVADQQGTRCSCLGGLISHLGKPLIVLLVLVAGKYY